MRIGSREISSDQPCYVVAELSANHGNDFELSKRTIQAMKDAGADAVKVQTYTADGLTISCDQPPFRVKGGTPWDGQTLYELYEAASMPWEWQSALMAFATEIGLDFFSTPFDARAVEFLEDLGVPAHKVASFELVDHGLLREVAATGKPVILSTGMASLAEIEESVAVLRDAGSGPLALLKCTSAYPAPPEEMHLSVIPDLQRRFDVPVGLSDHTLGSAVPLTAIGLGCCILEKHFTMSRDTPGPDSSFSMEPSEFGEMVDAIRLAEAALGTVSYDVSASEEANLAFRRSLFVVEDVWAGETFTDSNVRSIRPGDGLHPRSLNAVLGSKAAQDIPRGSPLSEQLVEGGLNQG